MTDTDLKKENNLSLNYLKSGWVNLYKPSGKTSTQSIGIIRKNITEFLKSINLISEKEKLPCGHMGTLDPMAEGVLPIAFGEATKTIPYHEEGIKEYIFTIRCGEQTDTDDATGKIIATSNKIPTKEEIEKIITTFIGNIKQTPSKFSAIHINGIRAYDLARNNQNFEMPTRNITIHNLSLIQDLNTNQDNNTSTFIVKCSKGTYVRTLCKDISERLNTKGHLIKLIRTQNGNFTSQQSITLDNFLDFFEKLKENTKHKNNESLINDARIKDILKPIDYMLDGIPGIEIANKALQKFQKGIAQSCKYQEGFYKIYYSSNISEDIKQITSLNDKRIMIGFGLIQKGLLKPKKVFNIK